MAWDLVGQYLEMPFSKELFQMALEIWLRDHGVSKVSKTRGICSISKNDARRGTIEEDLQRCIFRGRRNTRDMLIRAVRRSGR